jgi:hypothetical protein
MARIANAINNADENTSEEKHAGVVPEAVCAAMG